MRLKDDTIDLNAISSEIVLGLIIIDQVMQKNGGEAVITSAVDGRHSETSLHYRGDAVDVRSKQFIDPEDVLLQCIKALGLNRDYDMILEFKGKDNEHFHLEFQPKFNINSV